MKGESLPPLRKKAARLPATYELSALRFPRQPGTDRPTLLVFGSEDRRAAHHAIGGHSFAAGAKPFVFGALTSASMPIPRLVPSLVLERAMLQGPAGDRASGS